VRVALVVLAILVPLPSAVAAQLDHGGVDFNLVVGGDEFVRGCSAPFSLGFGVHGGWRTGRFVSAAAAARIHAPPAGVGCDTSFQPPDGIYIEDDRTDLLSETFFTTDIRIGARLGTRPGALELSIGAGMAWQPGRDLPLAIVAMNVPMVILPDARVDLTVDYTLLLVSSDRYRRTYQTGLIVDDESLGSVRNAGEMLTLGVRLQFPGVMSR
jgi:hypothetical protein